MSPPAAVTARRAQSQSPAVALTSCRAASPGCWQRRVDSSTRTRSHVRQIESSQPRPQFGQVLRRRRSQILPRWATVARRLAARFDLQAGEVREALTAEIATERGR